MVAFAFGAGFFNAASKERDRIKAEEADMKKMMWQNWQNNTLPEIRAARQVDELATSKMEQYLADPRVQGQPELAHYIAKGTITEEWKNIDDFFTKYEKDQTIVDPAIREKQLKALQSRFSYDMDDTGRASNFRLKQDRISVEPAPRRTLGQILSGRKTTQQLEQEAAGAMPGESIYQPTTPQFGAVKPSGTLSLKPIDQDRKKTLELITKENIKSPYLLNMSEYTDALLNQGPEAAARVAKFDDLPARERREFDRRLNVAVTEHLLKVAEETGNKELFNVLDNFDRKAALKAIAESTLSPEEKAKRKAEVSRLSGEFPDWAKNMTTLRFVSMLPDDTVVKYLGKQGYSSQEARDMKKAAKEVIAGYDKGLGDRAQAALAALGLAGLPPAAGTGANKPLEPGNIDLTNRPKVKNADGSVSTVSSIGIEDNGVFVNIPTISPDGTRLSEDDAVQLYRRTGQHLGKYQSQDEADKAAKQLSDQLGRELQSESNLRGQEQDPMAVTLEDIKAVEGGKTKGMPALKVLQAIRSGAKLDDAGMTEVAKSIVIDNETYAALQSGRVGADFNKVMKTKLYPALAREKIYANEAEAVADGVLPGQLFAVEGSDVPDIMTQEIVDYYKR